MGEEYSKALKQENQQFLELISKNMDLERWGFVQTYSSTVDKETLPFSLVYDSQQCRVKFEYYKPDFGGVSHEHREVEILYGRLHTRNDSKNVHLIAENKNIKYWYS